MSKQDGELFRAIGLMSGTSLDGIDIALIETDGEAVVHHGPSLTVPYSEGFREKLADGLKEAVGVSRRVERPRTLQMLEGYLTGLHAEAVSQFLEDHEIDGESIDIIGFHGQTVLHRPEAGLTVQIGDGQALADALHTEVAYDMRAADVAAGGQGAPLVPVYHRALLAELPIRPVAVLNLGGVGNVTWIGEDGTLIAFDTGPGNALIDDWMRREAGVAADFDGEAGLKGRARRDIVAEYLTAPFFQVRGPKSLDRNSFSLAPLHGLPVEDGAATLALLTAEAVAASRALMPAEPRVWIVAGGGRRNRAIMAALGDAIGQPMRPAEDLGLDGDAVEAEAWAYLAVRAKLGLPLTFPGTTGVAAPMTGGVIAKPHSERP